MPNPPKDGLERITWAVSPADGDELKARYDAWAQYYDSDLMEVESYRGPAEAAKVAARYLDPNGRILDAACGTGLSGEAMRKAGFRNLVGVDFSRGMLDVARGKGIYAELHQADLAEPLNFPDDSFHAVTIVGESLHLPARCYYEFVRIVAPGGYILYCGSDAAVEERGVAEICEEFREKGRLEPVETTQPFQALPKSEPELTYRVFVHRVLA